MDRVVRIFNSFAEADAADAAEDMSIPPERRIAILLELQERMYPDASKQRLARVHRIIKLEQS